MQGGPIDIRAQKVVAGLEPENTNMFLIAFAECASNRNIDNDQAVRRCLDGEQPGQGPIPLRSVSDLYQIYLNYVCVCAVVFTVSSLSCELGWPESCRS